MPVYEGYGPNGVAVMVEVTTDNKNRTHSEIKKIFSSHGGNLGESGCVNWMFHPKGYIAIDKSKVKEDELMNIAIDSGAEDVKTDDENLFEIITQPADFEKIKQTLLDKKIEFETAENTMLPTTYIDLKGNDGKKMLELIDEMEEHDDVKNVYTNFEILE